MERNNVTNVTKRTLRTSLKMTCVIFVTFKHVNLNFLRLSYRKKKELKIEKKYYLIFLSVEILSIFRS